MRGDEDCGPVDNVKIVQLAASDDVYSTLNSLLGKQATISGQAFGAHTAHHFTPFLISVKSVR